MAAPRTRLNAEERREQILEAATDVFGAVGYAAGTTDAIARAAGISQAYVVRTFGSKEALLLAVVTRACDRVASAFREAIASFSPLDTPDQKAAHMGGAFTRLIADRGLMLALMHAFAQGHDPQIGPVVREGFLRIYRIVRYEAGLGEMEAMRFMAHGMLIDVLLALRLQDSDDHDARQLVAKALNMKVDHLHTLRGVVGNPGEFSARR